jgi:hypothetical protein
MRLLILHAWWWQASLGGDLVELFRKNKSKYYWYDFTVRGERYRGSTRPTKRERKRLPLSNSLPLLRAATRSTGSRPRFVNTRRISFNGWKRDGSRPTAADITDGWRLLEQTKIAGMRMDQITKDEVEKLQFPGSASNGNNALRTLRRMYSKAKEHKMIFEVPDFALFKEHGRSLRLNHEAERRLSAAADQLLKDIIVARATPECATPANSRASGWRTWTSMPGRSSRRTARRSPAAGSSL